MLAKRISVLTAGYSSIQVDIKVQLPCLVQLIQEGLSREEASHSGRVREGKGRQSQSLGGERRDGRERQEQPD